MVQLKVMALVTWCHAVLNFNSNMVQLKEKQKNGLATLFSHFNSNTVQLKEK